MSSTINWYNKISPLFNLLNFGDNVYRRARRKVITMLNLQEGDIVINQFCGTGVNFVYLLDSNGETGHIIAVDGSGGMLAQDQRRIQQNGWPENCFTLLQRDLSDNAPDFLDNILSEGNLRYEPRSKLRPLIPQQAAGY
jgi:ubiquinone/menaquinone biosynthesis C-methylase UbiE